MNRFTAFRRMSRCTVMSLAAAMRSPDGAGVAAEPEAVRALIPVRDAARASDYRRWRQRGHGRTLRPGPDARSLGSPVPALPVPGARGMDAALPRRIAHFGMPELG